MVLARHEFDATDDAGNVLSNVTVEVRRESTNELMSLYSDRAGAVSIGNPVVFSDGKVAFHVVGGAYKITLTAGTYSRTINYVGVGLAKETDAANGISAGLKFGFSTTTTDADPGMGFIRFDSATPGSIGWMYISDQDFAGNNIEAWLQTLDDSTSATKALVTCKNATDEGQFMTFGVTGSAIDGTDYWKIPVSLESPASPTLFSDLASIVVQTAISADVGPGGDMSGSNNLNELTTPATARSNLGLVIGTDVQAYVSQTWADVTGSRLNATSYQNTTGAPISVAISVDEQTGNVSANQASVSANNSTWVNVFKGRGSGQRDHIFFVVPDNYYYRLNQGGSDVSITNWAEFS